MFRMKLINTFNFFFDPTSTNFQRAMRFLDGVAGFLLLFLFTCDSGNSERAAFKSEAQHTQKLRSGIHFLQRLIHVIRH